VVDSEAERTQMPRTPKKKTAPMTKLVMQYARSGGLPNIIVILKREPCTVHKSCSCDIYRIVNVTLLQPGEQTWCLQQSFTNRELAHRESA
jgi:hypothetical protein